MLICLRSAVFVIALAVPAVAWGQSTTSPRWFVGGLGGVTFGTVTNGAFGAQFGVKIAPSLFVIAEVGHMADVLPKGIRDDVRNFEDALAAELGVPVTLEISTPATYSFGGIRWMHSRGGVVPFLEAGLGVGHVAINIDEATIFGVDISNEVEDELGSEQTTNKFLVALGGGISKIMGAVTVDGGYRYTRIATEDPAINSSMVYVAVKFGR